jgi:two-component SAPR family response regulator
MCMSTILLLEDEALIAMDIEKMLGKMAAGSVASFGSCSDASEWLAHNSPDIAILDIQLRDGECLEVADILVQRNIPFIVHSARRSVSGERYRIFLNGLWIPKPSVPQDLMQGVENVLPKKRLVAA